VTDGTSSLFLLLIINIALDMFDQFMTLHVSKTIKMLSTEPAIIIYWTILILQPASSDSKLNLADKSYELIKQRSA
jgi:hypothetical protein